MYAPNPAYYLGNTYKEFLVDSVGKYQYYRLYCVQADVSNPGLSSMQLFVYDDWCCGEKIIASIK